MKQNSQVECSVDGSVIKIKSKLETKCFKITHDFSFEDPYTEISLETYNRIYLQAEIDERIEFRKVMSIQQGLPVKLSFFWWLPEKLKFWKNWDCMNDPKEGRNNAHL